MRGELRRWTDDKEQHLLLEIPHDHLLPGSSPLGLLASHRTVELPGSRGHFKRDIKSCESKKGNESRQSKDVAKWRYSSFLVNHFKTEVQRMGSDGFSDIVQRPHQGGQQFQL